MVEFSLELALGEAGDFGGLAEGDFAADVEADGEMEGFPFRAAVFFEGLRQRQVHGEGLAEFLDWLKVVCEGSSCRRWVGLLKEGVAFPRLFAVIVGWMMLMAQARGAEREEEIFEKLRANPGAAYEGRMMRYAFYFGSHGEPIGLVADLMAGKEEFTKAICQELRKRETAKLFAYRDALIRVLARSKDAAAIPWLKERIEGNGKAEIQESFLQVWAAEYFRGADHLEIRAVKEPSAWLGFWREWFREERDEQIRFSILKAIHAWLYDAETLAFLKELARNRNQTAEIRMLTQVALTKRGEKPDNGTLKDVAEKVMGGGSVRVSLVFEMIEDMPHEAFAPMLITLVPESPEEKVGNAQWLLERITFRRDVVGKRAWDAWARESLAKGRAEWLKDASARITSLATTNVAGAAAFLDKATYRWKDPIMLGTMEELLRFPELHKNITGWINLTNGHYHEVPGLVEELRRLARRIELPGTDDLSKHYRQMTNSWEFMKQR